MAALEAAETTPPSSFTVTFGHVAAKASGAAHEARVVFHFVRPAGQDAPVPPETWRLACPPVRPAWQSRFEVPEALGDELSLALPRGEIEEDGWAFDGTMFTNVDGRKQRLHPQLPAALDAQVAQDAEREARELAARQQLLARGAA